MKKKKTALTCGDVSVLSISERALVAGAPLASTSPLQQQVASNLPFPSGPG